MLTADPRAVVSSLPEQPSEDRWPQVPSLERLEATLLLWTPSLAHHLLFLGSLPLPGSVRGTAELSKHTAPETAWGKGGDVSSEGLRKMPVKKQSGGGGWARGDRTEKNKKNSEALKQSPPSDSQQARGQGSPA